MIGAEAGETADASEGVAEGIVHWNPGGAVEAGEADGEGNRNFLIDDAPLASFEIIAGRGAHDVGAGGYEVNARGLGETVERIIFEPDAGGTNFGGEESWIVGIVATAER